LRAGSVGAGLALTGCLSASTAQGPDPNTTLSGLSVSASKVAEGFASPVDVAIPESGRYLVVDQTGQIRLVDDGGLTAEPYLDVTDRMVDVSGYSEQGLLGLALHPDFEDTGKLYVRYSAPPDDSTPSNYSHRFVLSEFTADPGADTVDPSTERTLLTIQQPQSNHNAGTVAFGPDGFLYVGVGDGGGANDQGTGHVDDWYDDVEGGNGQDVTENLLGSILRIDVDATDSEAYAVPEDNPLVGRPGLDEHYAWGFRNPWRMSFAPDGRLLVADVGQNEYEEVNVVAKGGNYGWNVTEGTACFSASSCPDETDDGQRLRDPVVEYPHGGDGPSGVAVIGGYVYRGDALSSFSDLYVFADWRAGGELFVAEQAEEGLWPLATVPVEDASDFGSRVLSFGERPNGELLVCTSDSGGSSGKLFELVPA
jgi:glucose/arabinose dehydrogenase